MSPRRARRNSRAVRLIMLCWALIIVAALAEAVLHVIGWAIVTAALTGSAYWAGRRQSPAGKLARNASYGRAVAREMDAVSPYPPEMLRRGRANGWIAPARSALLSAECAGGECVWCHDQRCEHSCGHQSRFTARAAGTQPGNSEPPF